MLAVPELCFKRIKNSFSNTYISLKELNIKKKPFEVSWLNF